MQLAQVFIAVGFNRRMLKKQDPALAEFHYMRHLFGTIQIRSFLQFVKFALIRENSCLIKFV